MGQRRAQSDYESPVERPSWSAARKCTFAEALTQWCVLASLGSKCSNTVYKLPHLRIRVLSLQEPLDTGCLVLLLI